MKINNSLTELKKMGKILYDICKKSTYSSMQSSLSY
jgi:hypothetical protein